MSHFPVWFSEEATNPKCSLRNCENVAYYYVTGMKIHTSCDSEQVVDVNEVTRNLLDGEPRACMESEEVGFLICYDCVGLFTSLLPDERT